MPRDKNANAYGSAPRWLLTMGDMNNLLLCFFIALFSLLSWDKPLYREGTTQTPGGQAQKIEEKSMQQALQVLQAAEQQEHAATARINIEGSSTEVARMPDYVLLTIGAEFDPFPEGDWHLQPNHYKIIDTIRTWMVDRKNPIEVHGYTGTNPEDALVMENLILRPFEKADLKDPRIVPDHRLLAHLRAREVMKRLVLPVPDGLRIDPSRVILTADGETGFRRGRPMAELMREHGELPRDLRGDFPAAFQRLLQEEQRKDRRVEIWVRTNRP